MDVVKIDKEHEASIQAQIKTKLCTYIPDCDDVLPEYIIVMVGNRKTRQQITNELETFMGYEIANEFTSWLDPDISVIIN